MIWANPFRFNGQIGRAQFWLTMLATDIAWFFNPVPVDTHELVHKHWGGETSLAYFTPVEPINALSWAFWLLNCILAGLYVWVIASGVVQRLNDLGIRWIWAARCFAGFVLIIALEMALGETRSSFAWLDAVTLLLMVPTAAVAAFGLIQMLLVPGYRSRSAAMPDGDMRKSSGSGF